ncbi:PrgI family protein [Candidatus Saccharibacteria bacterium]|nr:PrgI family protein [Candidatus Saccharibacteria bacterium]
MGTYKVIQDIEAEDKLLGPLTFRQFVFALIGMFLLYICFILYTKHVGILLIVFLPPAAFFIFFALPFGKDQPTEVWALAKLRFIFKPRKRIWDQSGVKELVTIYVPKKIEHIYTDGLSQGEVRSRLQTLASTIDSRGWAVKNVNVNMYNQAGGAVAAGSSDRLLDGYSMAQPVSDIEVHASDDILDEYNNPVAQQFEKMITASTIAHRKQLIDEMNGIREEQLAGSAARAAADNFWFLNSPQQLPANQTMFAPQAIQPTAYTTQIADGMTNLAPQRARALSAEEQAILEKIKHDKELLKNQKPFGHLRTIQPIDPNAPIAPAPVITAPDPVTPVAAAPISAPQIPVTTTPDPAIINLSNNNDLNIATLAREASKARSNGFPDDQGEVVISLR